MSAPDMRFVVDLAEYASERVIERVAPGWLVASYEPETDVPDWVEVHAVLSLNHTSGRKATELRGADMVTGQPIGIREWNNETVLCLNRADIARAKKKGGVQ